MKLEPIRIMGHNYRVIFNPKLDITSRTMGTCCSNTCEIEISEGMNFPRTNQVETLIHELIEALNYHMEMDLKHEHITQLGAGLFQILNDNPHIVKFIGGK